MVICFSVRLRPDTGSCRPLLALFEKTFTINAELKSRVEELERELSVWKEAFKTADGDRKVLSKNVLKLERSIGALKVRAPLHLHTR